MLKLSYSGSYIWYQSNVEKITKDFPSLQFKGHSTERPPLTDDFNYNYRKCRMKIYLQSTNYKLWNIVEATHEKPHTNYDQWINNQKKPVNIDLKVMNALFYA